MIPVMHIWRALSKYDTMKQVVWIWSQNAAATSGCVSLNINFGGLVASTDDLAGNRSRHKHRRSSRYAESTSI